MMAWYPEAGIGPIVAPRAARNLFPVSQWLFWKDVRVCPLYRQRLPRCPNMGMAKCIADWSTPVMGLRAGFPDDGRVGYVVLGHAIRSSGSPGDEPLVGDLQANNGPTERHVKVLTDYLRSSKNPGH